MKNIPYKLNILSIFHFEISGIDIKEEQPENIPLISPIAFQLPDKSLKPKKIFSTVLTSHLDISGKDNKEEQSENIDDKFFIFLNFQIDISGIVIKEEHPENKLPIL